MSFIGASIMILKLKILLLIASLSSKRSLTAKQDNRHEPFRLFIPGLARKPGQHKRAVGFIPV
jgi:hypothetical protein